MVGLKNSEIKKFFLSLIPYTQEPISPKEQNFCQKMNVSHHPTFDVNLFDNIIDLFIAEEVIEVNQLEEKNNGGH